MRKPAVKVLLIGIVAVIAIFALALFSAGRSKRYAFIKSDHPVDQMLSGKGEWTYYFEGGDPAKKAAEARAELIPAGFTEDTSQKPWFVFKKGDQEVIVCSHDQIEEDGSIFHAKLAPERPHPFPAGYVPTPAAVVYVHAPGGNTSSLVVFQIKKLALGW